MESAAQLPWVDPLQLAAAVRDPYWALLYSGAHASYSGRYSYLACNLAERIESDDFSALAQTLSSNQECFANAWFGYLGYGLKDGLETLVPEEPNWLALPNIGMMRFHTIYAFDHEKKCLTLWSDRPAQQLAPLAAAIVIPSVKNIRSPMTKKEYLEKAAYVIDRIHAGDLYQANLTRKFTGEFAETPDGFSLFRRLCEVSPAPYSAFLQLGDTAVISSSPERFLSIDTDGNITARPIKGTAARFADAAQDMASRAALAQSEKDRAENLMIVDLMRNDLSRTCVPGSVEVKDLFEVTTHATIHHMSSTISGKKSPEKITLDVIRECFPPGSMTGAPKIKAMNLCAELETYARGIYSGAIGWFGGDGSCDLSVAIRTLVVKGDGFEFQVGGGIVADSTPEHEFFETMHKAKGMVLALNLAPDALLAL